MATICNICGKGNRRAGHEVDLYFLDSAQKHDDSIVIWLVDKRSLFAKFCESDNVICATCLVDKRSLFAKFCESDNVICATCLAKLGVFESITKEQLKQRKRLPQASKKIPPLEE